MISTRPEVCFHVEATYLGHVKAGNNDKRVFRQYEKIIILDDISSSQLIKRRCLKFDRERETEEQMNTLTGVHLTYVSHSLNWECS